MRYTTIRELNNKKTVGNLSYIGYSQYNVNKNGEISNVATGRTLKPFIDRRGYENYSLWDDNGKRKTMRCHQIVARMFIPNPNNYPQVDHLDGNKRNNKVSNLEWVTNQENNLRARAHGLMTASNVYPKDIIEEICQLLSQNISMYEIARMLHCSKDLVFNIKHRISHKNISWAYDF